MNTPYWLLGVLMGQDDVDRSDEGERRRGAPHAWDMDLSSDPDEAPVTDPAMMQVLAGLWEQQRARSAEGVNGPPGDEVVRGD